MVTLPDCNYSPKGNHVGIDGPDAEYQTCLYCGKRV